MAQNADLAKREPMEQRERPMEQRERCVMPFMRGLGIIAE